MASKISGEVTTGLYQGYVFWDFIPSRLHQDEQTQYRQLVAEPRPNFAGYGEVLVLQQNECGLCSR